MLRKLKRLCLGKSAAISASTDQQGEVVTESADVAAAFKAH